MLRGRVEGPEKDNAKLAERFLLETIEKYELDPSALQIMLTGVHQALAERRERHRDHPANNWEF